MKSLPYPDMDLLNTFVKSAQYIVGLSSRQDLWEHVEKLLVTYFQADWAAFVRLDPAGSLSVDHCCPASDDLSQHLLTDHVRTIVHDVRESGFLACQVIPIPAPSMTVALPLPGEHQAGKALLIGHNTADPLPRERLNIYLALAGLAGTMLERLHVERELRLHREHLEGLVTARTAELAKAKRQNELILNAIGEGIFGVDADGKIIFVNPPAAQMTGWDPAELIGRNAHDTFHHTRCDGSPYPAGECDLHDTLRTGQTHHIPDMDFFRKDATTFPVESKTTAITEDGRIVGAVLVFRDITDRRRAQLEREITIEFLRLVNHNNGTRDLVHAATAFFQEHSGCQAVGVRLRDGDDYPYYEACGLPKEFLQLENSLCTRDPDGQVQLDSAGNPILACMCGNIISGRSDPSKPFFSPAGSFWTNCTTDLLAGTTDTDRQAQTRNRCNGQGYESVALIRLQAGQQRLGLLQLNDRRKGRFTLESIALWERLSGYLAVAIARARAVEALNEREEQLRLFIEHAPAAICMLDTQMRYLAVSRRWLDDYGLTGQPILGRSHYEVFPEIPDRWKQVHQRCLAGAVERAEEDPLPRTDGSVQWTRWEVRPWQAAGGTIGGIIIFSEDITQRKQAERQLKELNETLERRVAERTAEAEHRAEQLRALAAQLTQAEQKERQRLATILHDHLQQLLVGAKFNVGILKGQLEKPTQHESLKQVDDLLDESLDTSRGLTVDLCPPILQQGTMPQVLRWLGEWINRRHGLVVKLQTDERAHPQSPEVRVLLFQAVRELLFNVVKHAKVDLASVELSCAGQDHVQVVVSDTGAGFDSLDAQSDKASGSGFGLFSIRERLDWLGGNLEIVSAPGKGTRATIIAPIRLKTTETEAAAAIEVALPVGQPPAMTGGEPRPKVRVVLADDHAVMRDGLARLLATQPWIEVIGQAADGRQAIQMARQLQPDVIIMDINMPEIDGVEATRQVVAERPGTKVIGLSMFNEPDVARHMKAAGAADYLAKTSGPEVLVSAIRQCAGPKAPPTPSAD